MDWATRGNTERWSGSKVSKCEEREQGMRGNDREGRRNVLVGNATGYEDADERASLEGMDAEGHKLLRSLVSTW